MGPIHHSFPGINAASVAPGFTEFVAVTRKPTLFADVINIFGDAIGGHPYIYIPGLKRSADKFNPEIKSGIRGRF